jgi:sugar diacid utilization regulator
LTTSELAAINETARGLGPAMAMRDRGDPDVAAHEHLVLDLVSREPALRRRALSDLGASTDLDHFETVTAIEVGLASGSGGQGSSPAPAHVTMALRGALRLKPPAATAVLHAVGEGTALLLLGAATSVAEEVATAHATRLVEQVTDLAAGRFASVAGIGPRVTGLDQAVESATQARLARRAAGSVLAVPVASWAELGAYGPLLRIPAEQLTELALPAQLRRVLEIDRERQLTDTLRAYLDSGCLAPAAAKTLHIHRTTLYYRLGRITDLTGLDLTDGRTRLELHLGLAMLDLIDHDLRH